MEQQGAQPIAVTADNFAATVLDATRPVLVDFAAEWCGPCVAVAPVIRGLALEYADRLTVATVDVEANPELAASYGVRSLPTVLLVDRGHIRRVIVGARTGVEYRAAIDGLLH